MSRSNYVRNGWLCAIALLIAIAPTAMGVCAGAEKDGAPAEAAKHGDAPKGDEPATHEKSPAHGDAKHDEKPSLEEQDLSHANATPALGSAQQLKADLAIYTIVVFFLLLAVLWKFAWGPIMEGLAKREQTIADQIAAANQAAAEAKALLVEHQAKVASASQEVRQMIEEGRRDAETSAAKIVAEAHTAARRERDTALSQIDAAKNVALHQLSQKSVDIAIGLAGKIVSRQLTPQDHAQLIREAAAQLPSSN